MARPVMAPSAVAARAALLALALLILGWPAAAQLPAPGSGTHTMSFRLGDMARSYVAHLPPGAPARAPLVLVLHGAGGSGANALQQGRWAAAAGRHGFVVLAPDGLLQHPDRRASLRDNPRTWNSGPATGSWAAQAGIDDAGFLRALLSAWVAAGRADPARLYATGFSNGAGMAFRAGADLSDVLAAIAPVANGLLLPVERLVRPVPLLLIWGEEDPLNPIAGGQVRRAAGSVTRPGADASWRRWGALNACQGEARGSPAPDLVELAFRSCAGGAEVRLIRVRGLGHQWPGGEVYVRVISGPGSDALDATEAIWRFFAAHPRRG
jgi:polyhydroxybutyrate depolymerase